MAKIGQVITKSLKEDYQGSYINPLKLLAMSTRTNLSQYRKLSNTIELKGRYSTLQQPRLSETVKLPALNAINKSVKYNDLSFATSRNLNKLRKEPEGVDDYTEVAAHNILLAIRKKYDSMNKVREEKEREIEELETERQKYQIEKDKYADEKSNAEKKVRRLEEQLQNIKHLGEESEMEKRIMLHVASRIKYDKIVYDQRRFNHEKEFKHLRRTKEVIEREDINNHEEEDKTRKVYNKLVQHFEAEERERNLSIASLERMLVEKNNLVEYTTLREQEMKEIAENTLQDKDHNEKSWYKVYLCHRFVEKLLRDKMSREMVKFSTVEVAYKNIKTETGVSDTENLISKFLNKENIYGDLLGKIASDEKQISDLKTMNDEMTRERSKLKSESSVLVSNKKDKKDLSQEEKEHMTVSEKSMKCQLFSETISLWLQRNQKKFMKLQNKQVQRHYEGDSAVEIISIFKEYVTLINSSLDESKQASANDLSDISEGVKNKTNFRVKPVQQKNEQTRQNNETKEHDQDEFVNHQREQLHRDNEKFMRELKKRHEQTKRSKLQGEPKRKQPSPEKGKQGEAS